MTPRSRRVPTHAHTITAIVPGGAWLPAAGVAGPSGRQPTLFLERPERVLVAHRADEIVDLIAQVETEQRAGNHVVGYLAYEAGAAFGLTTKNTSTRIDALERPVTPDSLPLAWMGVYPPASVHAVTPDGRSDDDGVDPDPTSPAHRLSRSSLTLGESVEEYSASIGRVRELIAAGDTYQVNYTVRARFDLDMDPMEYFLGRVSRHPVPYAAYLDMGDFQVISLSPELFLRQRGDRLESRPMKGTRPRGPSPEKDIALGYELVLSEKDRAENLMIVDMVRNDLGRVCRTGSVHVPALFALEPYGTVWQMASTVIGEVSPGANLVDIFAATFPGASVTGAPKHHTMEIIRDLEREPRGVYTGTVCVFLPNGDFTCNLAIRTIAHRQGKCVLGVGSGVVWDSDADEEYEETWTKAAFVFRDDFTSTTVSEDTTITTGIFETLLLKEAKRASSTPGEDLSRYLWLEAHLERMTASAGKLELPFALADARAILAEHTALHEEAATVRLTLDTQGHLTLTTRPVPTAPERPVRLLLSPFRTEPGDIMLRHKTAMRPLYDREHARAVRSDCLDALFINLDDHVTEGAISNIFVRDGAAWYTPPVTDGLLPGIWRAHFARETGATERSLTLDDLVRADEVVIGNSVRGRIQVSEILERPW